MASMNAPLTRLDVHFAPDINTMGGENVLLRIKGIYFHTGKFKLKDGHLVIPVFVDSEYLASFHEQADEQTEITRIDEVA